LFIFLKFSLYISNLKEVNKENAFPIDKRGKAWYNDKEAKERLFIQNAKIK
jgi:hypothetical protein